MESQTKEKALEKCDKFGVKIGFPDKWIDYSALECDVHACYVTNVLSANKFEHLRDVRRVNKDKDRTRWEMSPQTVNAYYHPLDNEIVFPAAILQFPMFDVNVDAAVNFGAMGAVIAHEMTHGYDDQGRKFDSSGNMQNWWTEQDTKNFNERAGKIVDQFNKYEVYGKKVNGELTQGENIADLGGLSLAYKAMMRHFEKHGRPADIDGFTAEQRFFLSWGQVR
jgi:putative endopeptidase